MSIPQPTSHDFLTKQQQFGLIDAAQGEALLDRILTNGNYFYRYYSPAMLDATCFGDATATSHTYVAPVIPSADGLAYTFESQTWTASNSVVSIAIALSTTDSSTFGATVATITTAGAAQQEEGTVNMTVGATTTFVKFTATCAVGFQMQSVQAFPQVAVTITSGVKASGFVAFENALLNATASPLGTEFFNRAQRNLYSVVNDRTQCLHAALFDSLDRGYRDAAAATSQVGQMLWKVPGNLPGGKGNTVKVHVRASTSGAGSHSIRCGDISSNTADLTCDDSDKTGTFTIGSDQPDFHVSVDWDGAGNVQPLYVSFTHQWALTTGDMLTAATPPAKQIYITGLASIYDKWIGRPYPVVGKLIDFADAGGADWYVMQRIGPYTHRWRAIYGQSVASPPGGGSPSDMTTKSTNTGSSASETITVAPPFANGTNAFPVTNGQQAIKFKVGGLLSDTSPSATVDRCIELAASQDTPYTERVWTDNYHMLGGYFIQANDLI